MKGRLSEVLLVLLSPTIWSRRMLPLAVQIYLWLSDAPVCKSLGLLLPGEPMGRALGCSTLLPAAPATTLLPAAPPATLPHYKACYFLQ